jgi:hypothetical protein
VTTGWIADAAAHSKHPPAACCPEPDPRGRGGRDGDRRTQPHPRPARPARPGTPDELVTSEALLEDGSAGPCPVSRIRTATRREVRRVAHEATPTPARWGTSWPVPGRMPSRCRG